MIESEGISCLKTGNNSRDETSLKRPLESITEETYRSHDCTRPLIADLLAKRDTVEERPEIPEIKPVSESSVGPAHRRRSTDGSVAFKPNLDVVANNKSLIPLRWQRKTAKAGSVVESFYHAFHGIRVALTEQRNLRIHVCAAILATIMGLSLGIDILSWIALTIIMSLVIACELINTSLEHLVDISADGKYRYAARCAKDTAAAAVLTVSVGAIVVGLLIFGPKLMALLPH